MSQPIEKTENRSPEPTNPTTPKPKFGKGIYPLFPQGFGLIIGVGRCTYDHWTLPVTTKDAEALYNLLIDDQHCGYLEENVELRTDEDATRAEILTALETLGEKASHQSEATVVVYYSGHGWLDGEGNYYLVPSDTDPFDLAGSALRAEDFTAALRKIRPERLLVILDTCHAAGMAEAKEAIPPGFRRKAPPEEMAKVLTSGQGRAVLSSCRDEQRSWIRPDNTFSLFTDHLLEAFRGAGSPTEAEFVSILDLMNYVSREVESSAKAQGRTQTPFHKLEADSFPVAYRPVESTVKPPEPQPKPDSRTGPIAVNKAGRDIIGQGANVGGDLNTTNQGS